MSNLRTLANTDLQSIVTDQADGFGWPITITDPAGTSAALVGRSNDIGLVIDPDTGLAVSGRSASVAVTITSLSAAGLGLPVGVEDTTGKPWVVVFNSINGSPYTFRVIATQPDRALGIVVCLLETYNGA